MLREGQYFFTDIEKEGIVLYDSGNTQLAERKPLSPQEVNATLKNWTVCSPIIPAQKNTCLIY